MGTPLLFIAEYLNNKLMIGIVEQIDKNLASVSSSLTDCIMNIHTIHAYNLESTIEDQLNKDLDIVNRLGSSRTTRSGISNILSILCPTTFMILTFGFGSLLVSKNWIDFLQLYLIILFSCCILCWNCNG